MPKKSRLDKIIEDATVDCYDDYELYTGWQTILEDAITKQQECLANGNKAIFLETRNPTNSVNALVEVDGKRLIVPMESIKLSDKRQNEYVQAYKKWLNGNF